MGRTGRWAGIATILDVQECRYWNSASDAGGSYAQHSGLFLRNLRAHKGGGRDLLAGAGPESGVQEGAPVSCCARRAAIGVRADQLQHAGRGPVVEGQLPGAVAAHPDPHGPQQHGHAWHALVGRGCHGHIVAGLCLRRKT